MASHLQAPVLRVQVCGNLHTDAMLTADPQHRTKEACEPQGVLQAAKCPQLRN